MYMVSVPITVPVSKKKKFSLNLNQYRNAHHHTLAKAKEVFAELVEPLVKHLPQMPRVRLSYVLYAPSEQLVDTNNVCSIVDKFFSDVLVKAKRITDDNRKIVIGSEFHFGAVDRGSPRCEVTVIPVGPEDDGEPVFLKDPQQEKAENMQITLIESEIKTAITDYIAGQGFRFPENSTLAIELSATRGPEGMKATVDVVPAVEEPPVAPAKATRSPRAKTTEAKPVVETEAVKPASDQTETPDEVTPEVTAEPGVEAESTEVTAEQNTAPARSLFGGNNG